MNIPSVDTRNCPTFSANYLLQIISRWDMRYFVAPILTRPSTIFANMFGVIWGVGELLLTSMFALYLIGDQYSCGNKLSVSNI